MEERADVELTIQIGMETDEEALAVLVTEARREAKEALRKSLGKAEYRHETQWCSGAMRVTVQRPLLSSDTNGPNVTSDTSSLTETTP